MEELLVKVEEVKQEEPEKKSHIVLPTEIVDGMVNVDKTA